MADNVPFGKSREGMLPVDPLEVPVDLMTTLLKSPGKLPILFYKNVPLTISATVSTVAPAWALL